MPVSSEIYFSMSTTPLKAPVLNAGELPKQSIRDQVYALLRDRLHKGEITSEDRLVDHELAAQLKVSRMPVREALLQLKTEGYLEGTSRGFILPQFTPQDIANMFEVRLLLEAPAAAISCSHATVEGLGKMKVAVDAAEKAHRKSDVMAYMDANWAFWAAWVDMVPNTRLVQTIYRLRDHAQYVRIATLQDTEFREISLYHTKEILAAFMKRDTEAVKDRVAHNLRMSASSYYATQQALMEKDEA